MPFALENDREDFIREFIEREDVVKVWLTIQQLRDLYQKVFIISMRVANICISNNYTRGCTIEIVYDLDIQVPKTSPLCLMLKECRIRNSPNYKRRLSMAPEKSSSLAAALSIDPNAPPTPPDGPTAPTSRANTLLGDSNGEQQQDESKSELLDKNGRAQTLTIPGEQPLTSAARDRTATAAAQSPFVKNSARLIAMRLGMLSAKIKKAPFTLEEVGLVVRELLHDGGTHPYIHDRRYNPRQQRTPTELISYTEIANEKSLQYQRVLLRFANDVRLVF